MKLLMCDSCGDVFNLKLHLKSCSCGKTKGRYITNETAEVNGNGHSLAIGNGSLMLAIRRSFDMQSDWRDGRTNANIYDRHPTAILCWARPHEGPANSHTKINRDL